MIIEYRLALEEDIPAIVNLNKEVYGDDFFTNTDYFRWRFFSPFQKESFIVGAFEGALCVGMTGLCISRYVQKGTTRKVGVLVSSVIRPKYRYILERYEDSLKTMYDVIIAKVEDIARERKCDALIGFPNDKSYPFFVNNFGYSLEGYLDFLFYPLYCGKIFKAFGLNIPGISTALGFLLDLVIKLSRIRLNVKKNRIQTAPINNPLFEKDLLQIQRGQDRIEAVKDALYFQWRFIDPKILGYEHAKVIINDSVQGYIIWKTGSSIDRKTGKKITCTKLVDYYIIPGSNSSTVFPALVKEMLISAKNQHSTFVYSSVKLPKTDISLIKKAGFIFLRGSFFGKKMPMVMKRVSSNLSARGISDWRLTMSDNDIV
jgi:hypothetical protein